MKTRWGMVWGILLLVSAAVAQDAPVLKSQKEKLSYALGMDLGNQLKKQSIEIEPALFSQGFKDAVSGGKAMMTEAEVRAVIAELQGQLQAKQVEATKVLAEKNKKEGEAFLAQNKAKEGIVALPSGLQYKILTAGAGNKPALEDTVVCHYKGTLIDGTEFDSSYKRNQPATFAVKGVIKGWTEALQLMAVGSKWQLFIPASLAYGESARGNVIGPNSTLLFEVELISIQGKK
ncbi:MAG: FKBP-type peptidyl-prolyl cis-trans isomerase [Acidobacteria bacterium]|nr:FKBP-type peptidyl-prolyl cis-trans isomerase [Acidobacteriota bacterium]